MVKVSCSKSCIPIGLSSMWRGIYSLPLVCTLVFFHLIKANKGGIALTSQGLTGVPSLNMTITVLHLGNNRIAELGPHEFSEAPELTKLFLSENLLTRVDDLAFCDTVIWHLDLAKNNLSEIPNLDCLNNTIKNLMLASNKIEYLHETSLQLLKRLSILDLNNNRLLGIHHNSLCGTILQKVHLMYNFIGILPDFGCVGKSISEIKMNGNQIWNISRGALNGVSNAGMYIDFSDNHLNDVSALSEMSNFSAHILLLTSNNITCIASVRTDNMMQQLKQVN